MQSYTVREGAWVDFSFPHPLLKFDTNCVVQACVRPQGARVVGDTKHTDTARRQGRLTKPLAVTGCSAQSHQLHGSSLPTSSQPFCVLQKWCHISLLPVRN